MFSRRASRYACAVFVQVIAKTSTSPMITEMRVASETTSYILGMNTESDAINLCTDIWKTSGFRMQFNHRGQNLR